ncbi:MAG TPA: hypothetical protein PLU61_11820 [Rhodoglobus sp.]|nr:hypothetical protein [Rhodoglobus sp.]
MLDFAGTINESILNPPSHEPEIALGRVGWPGDDDIVDLGTADNDGATLLKVTLHRGGYPGDIPKPGEAAGYRVRVRVMGPVFDVPPKGTEVCVAFPGGIGMVAGAGVLLGSLTRTPDHQFSATATKIDAGPDRDLVLKGRSVVLTRHNPDGTGAEDFVSVSPDGGIQALTADGCGVVLKDQTITLFVADAGDAKSVLSVTKDAMRLMQKVSATKTTVVSIAEDVVSIVGKTFRALCGNVALGIAAAQPVMLGTNMPSTAVFSQ